MAFKQGQTYRCMRPGCGCEIRVTASAISSEGTHTHRCCCGGELELVK